MTNATWVNTFQQAVFADLPQKELNGYTTDPFASNDGFLKWKGVSRLDWAWNGWDLVLTANYLDGFHDRYPNGLLHYTSQTWFFDGQLSYDFTFVPPVENQPVAGYSKDAKDVTMGKDGKATESAVTQTAAVALPLWKQVLNGTTITTRVATICLVRILRGPMVSAATRPIILASFMIPPDASFTCS